MKRQIILIVLDGWGIGKKNISNPIYIAKTPNIDYIKSHFLIGSLQASGIAVGLPWGEEGNSEVGHLTIGAGKILYQHFPRISIAIKDGSFFKNKIFLNAIEHVKKNNSALNIAGLLTEANIHASLEHLIALIKLANENKITKTNLHLYTDGKDCPLRSAPNLLKKLEPYLDKNVKIATVLGRYYALDRNNYWDRTQEAYNVLVGNGPVINNIEELLGRTYQNDLSDEFVKPHLIGSPDNFIKDNDALIFFDFREDSVRQIVEPFINPQFQEFPAKKFNNLYVVTITSYSEKFTNEFKVPVAYPPEKITNPLGKVLADNKKSQLRLAETLKYAHVTYFFNGLNERPYPNEFRILIPTHNVISHTEHPEMMASEITSRIIQSMQDNAFDFILANYANGDVIGHTGDFDAALKTVKTIDQEIGNLVKKAIAYGDIIIITSDHGNIENMLDPYTAKTTTGHDPSPVPIYLIAREFEKNKNLSEIEEIESQTIGILSDVAPTILEIMGIKKPAEMTGQSLLKFLK